MSDTQLQQLCVALGWQGGTFHQVLEEVKRLRAIVGSDEGLRLPPGYEVVGEDLRASNEPGAWTCKACGFRGFWRGLHCMRTGKTDVDPA